MTETKDTPQVSSEPVASVVLACPRCARSDIVARPPDIPAKVIRCVIICPDCDDGDFHFETWFAHDGREVLPDID